jgi:cytosine/adenosine deaminase-related metal-dependent hydrolase
MRMLVHARNATIACDGDRLCAPEGRFDVVLDCREADVRPGLINSHEHLHRNHYGRLGKPPYRNAAHWARDIQRRHRRRIAAGRGLPHRQAYLAGAWKNLFAGVTSVVHHDAWDDELARDFPLRVVRVANDDSVSLTPVLGAGRKTGSPDALHLAEGTDEQAAREVATIARAGLLDKHLLAVHLVGPGEAGIERFRRSGAALVWCPSSNHFLFGRTAPQSLFAGDTDVLLGSDSLLTGQGNLLDELRFARASGHLDDERLEQAVGTLPARRLGLPAPALEPGAPADFVLLTAPLLEANARHVRLVVAAGVPRVAAAEGARHLDKAGVGGVRRTVAGVTRWTRANAKPLARGSQ